MSQSNAPMYVILYTDGMTQAQVEEINRLTQELRAVLERQSDVVGSVTLASRDDLPQGAKSILEVLLAEQVIVHVAPIVMNWVLGKIDGTIKSLSQRIGKPVKAKVIVGNREVQITPATTPQELSRVAQHVKAASELSPNRRFALIIGNSNYQDQRLPDLKSSVADAERFANVLQDPNIGAFTSVETLIDKTHDVIEHHIEKFFKNRLREDLLLLYFSGHGIKSQNGQLFLAAQNTISDLLRSTGVAANFIRENMGESESQRQILVLDCCYGGAIVEGAKSDNTVGQAVNSILSFKPSGFGKIIITASESMQYAFDGKRVEGQTQNSLFTRYLIEGLQTGKADADNDGLVNIEELYQFAYKHVTPQQTPNISSTAQEGQLYIGFNPNPSIQVAQLSDQLQQAMFSETRLHRQGAVSELARLLKSPDPSMVLSAEMALRKMTGDDSKSVADYAQEILDQHFRTQTFTIPEPALPKSSLPESNASVLITNTAPVPSSARAVPNIPSSTSAPTYGSSVTSQRNENAGGCLNVIVPGLAYMLLGNQKRAILTFVVAVIAFSTLGVFFFLDGGLCSGPAALAMMIYLFISGRNAILKENRRKP